MHRQLKVQQQWIQQQLHCFTIIILVHGWSLSKLGKEINNILTVILALESLNVQLKCSTAANFTYNVFS